MQATRTRWSSFSRPCSWHNRAQRKPAACARAARQRQGFGRVAKVRSDQASDVALLPGGARHLEAAPCPISASWRSPSERLLSSPHPRHKSITLRSWIGGWSARCAWAVHAGHDAQSSPPTGSFHGPPTRCQAASHRHQAPQFPEALAASRDGCVRRAAAAVCSWQGICTTTGPGGAENHTDGLEGTWAQRVAMGLKACYEWMPVREVDRHAWWANGGLSIPWTASAMARPVRPRSRCVTATTTFHHRPRPPTASHRRRWRPEQGASMLMEDKFVFAEASLGD